MEEDDKGKDVGNLAYLMAFCRLGLAYFAY